MKAKTSIAVLSAFIFVAPLTATAAQHFRSEQHWHGNIHNFHQGDIHHWAGGHWYHGGHDGRLGWWWVVGAAVDSALWYSYPVPVYPYPDPYAPTVVVSPQPAPMVQQAPQMYQPTTPSVWYFCQSSGKYYPYTSSCPEGWQTVPATPPSQ
jgi:hypothetical protein